MDAVALSTRAERAAVRGAAHGDPAAVAALFRAHWPAAYRAAWLIVRDDHAAEDLAQEGFVAAFGALDRFDRSRPFGPWLRTIVARRAIDAMRARAARPCEVDGSAALALLPSPVASPGAAAPSEDVLAAVAALPDEQRSVVVLRHLLELTPSEIADVVGVPTGTVNSRLRRGLDALAKALAVAAIVAFALTQPGRATAEWVREHLSKVTGHAAPVTPPPVRSYGSLPGGGRLLVVNAHGPTVLGVGAAPRVLLGRVDTAAWSPHGRFVVAVRGIELIAVDLKGRRRWHVAGRHALRRPAWSPSGFRVAYLDGRELRVVNGDGTGDRLISAASRRTPPAWLPDARRHLLAYADSANRIVLRDLDAGRILWRARPAHTPTALAWAGRRHLLALDAHGLTTYSATTGRRLAHAAAPAGTENTALATRGAHVALLRHVLTTGDHRVLLDDRLVAAGPGRIASLALSPSSRWLALDPPDAAPFTLLRTTDGTTRTLSAGSPAKLGGWCCTP
jgi:RNA polymerase sigma-70 factor (ECF subfamily)